MKKMGKNHFIKCAVTKQQKELIRAHANRLGYRFMAEYVRDLAIKGVKEDGEQVRLLREIRELLENDQRREIA